MGATPEKTRVVQDLKHGKPLVSCRFDPTGRYLFAGSEDDTVVRWDWSADPARARPVSFAAHDGWVFALAVTPDGKTLLSGGTDGRLIWWPDAGADARAAAAPKPLRTIMAHHGWVRGAGYSPGREAGRQLRERWPGQALVARGRHA